MDFETLSLWADEELKALLKVLPQDIQDSAMEESDVGELPRIRLFLMNLWQWAGQEEHDYRDEVGTTFLHELGHYLGWDEDQIAQRGLE
jgi:predicted Zn-dependent protease with MMP-like domain